MIYPGHGQKFVGRDGKVSFFITQKAEQLFHQKIKAAKLTWTQAWRHANKKGRTESTTRRKAKKAGKFQKAIAGMSLEDMKRKRAQKGELRAKVTDAAAKEAKARQSKKGSA